MNSAVALARRAVLLELALYRSLARWVTRRPKGPAGAVAYAYVGALELVLWAFIVVGAVELVVLHLIVPWEALRIAFDIISLWGLIWMLGFSASLHVHPHLVTASGLRVRYGATIDVTVPWDAIATIGVRERSRDKSKTVQVDRVERGAVLNVVTASRTNVDLTLNRPLEVPLPKGAESITELRFYADDARGLANRVREQAQAAGPRVTP